MTLAQRLEGGLLRRELRARAQEERRLQRELIRRGVPALPLAAAAILDPGDVLPRSQFFPAIDVINNDGQSVEGNLATVLLDTNGGTDTISINMQVPFDLTRVDLCRFLFFPTATGTIQFDFQITAVALGETEAAGDGQDTLNQTQAVTINVLEAFDLGPAGLSALPTLTPLDIVGVLVTLDTTTINADVLGIQLVYR